MTSMLNSGKVFNPVCKVEFAGFMSDTYTLQKNGWQISAQQDMRYDGIRLALKHEGAHLYALTGYVASYAVMQCVKDMTIWDSIVFRVQVVAPDIRFHIMPERASAISWNAIDARPDFAPNYEVKGIEDLIPFRPIANDVPEIVLAPASVQELLAMAISMQDPKQKEIREKARKENWKMREDGKVTDANSAKDIRAQIVTLVG